MDIEVGNGDLERPTHGFLWNSWRYSDVYRKDAKPELAGRRKIPALTAFSTAVGGYAMYLY
jgi:hypothetical protein